MGDLLAVDVVAVVGAPRRARRGPPALWLGRRRGP
jgi:hypothetical protein